MARFRTAPLPSRARMPGRIFRVDHVKRADAESRATRTTRGDGDVNSLARSAKARPPVGVKLGTDIETLTGRRQQFRARVRWTDPATGRRPSVSCSHETYEAAQAWLDDVQRLAAAGVDPETATATLAEYGKANMHMALRGLEAKTTDPYLAGWRKRVVPTIGHLPVTMLTYGVVDRAVHAWIADGHSKSTIKNSLAILVRVLQQAVRDELLTRNPARIKGWQKEYQQAEDELDNPRALALPNWAALVKLADALVSNAHGNPRVWGDVVLFAGCTGARIGEISGCRVGDIDTKRWVWTLRRQTTPTPGGLTDKGTKGNRAREIPLIPKIRDLVQRRIDATDGSKDARLFTGLRGGRIATAVLRDATDWDKVITKLGYEHLRRHDLRHTALTWFADAGVPVHHLQKIAGHGSITTTQRYLHPNQDSVTDAGHLLDRHLDATAADSASA